MQYLGRHEFPTVRSRAPRAARQPTTIITTSFLVLAPTLTRALPPVQAWRALECVLVSEQLVAIQEPVTWIDAKDMLVSVATNVAYGNVSDEQEILANEARSQLVPENQQNFRKAYFTLRGFSLARFSRSRAARRSGEATDR